MKFSPAGFSHQQTAIVCAQIKARDRALSVLAVLVRRIGQIKDGTDIVGNRTRVKVVKNKMAPPFRQTEFDIIYGEGVSKVGEIIDIGVDYEIIKKSGSWFSYMDSKLGQGRDAVKRLLQDNPELMEELEEKIVNAIKKWTRTR